LKRRTRVLRTDTVILGAGAAGLAAASELVRAGGRCIVLEARPRIGGRVCTQPVATGPSPELGAEFIHGESPPTWKRLRAHGHVAVDAPTERWILQGRHLRRADGQFDALKRCLRRLPVPDEQASFADYLALHRRRLMPDVRRFALTLVQGFDAADPARIDAREVIDEWSGPAAADQATYRPMDGYGPLLEAMRASMSSTHVRFVLRAVVEQVRWRSAVVEAHATQHGHAPLIVRARRAIVTLPLGVLQSAPGDRGHVVFDPPLTAKSSALLHLHSGPVHKAVMRFRRPFWTEHDDGRYRNAVPATPQARRPPWAARCAAVSAPRVRCCDRRRLVPSGVPSTPPSLRRTWNFSGAPG
jgi:monoamine oxidase